jgi:hypothetical protein
LAEVKSYSPLKIGLLITAVVWFLFSFHELFKATVNISEYTFFFGPGATWILVTDVSGVIGLIARTMAGLVAVTAILFYFARGLSRAFTLKIVKAIIVFEAVYCLSLLISGIWGVLPPALAGFGGPGVDVFFFNWSFLINTGIPCLVESIAIPLALIKLFFALNPNKPQKGAIKWGLIAGTLYVFVFWLNNATSWIIVVMEKGTEYVTAYPDHILSFGLTTIGLLALAVYAAYFTKKSIGTESCQKLDLRKIGAIITALGLYFLIIYVMWLAVGTKMEYVPALDKVVDVKWSNWYAWFLGHNMDLWALSLPLVGLPLLFKRKSS